jgi:hypothetical protein
MIATTDDLVVVFSCRSYERMRPEHGNMSSSDGSGKHLSARRKALLGDSFVET